MLLDMKDVEEMASEHENIEKLTSEVVKLRHIVDKQQKKVQEAQAMLLKSENCLFLRQQRYYALQSDSFRRASPVVRTSVAFQQGSAAASSTSIGLANVLQDPSLTRVNAQNTVAVVEQVYHAHNNNTYYDYYVYHARLLLDFLHLSLTPLALLLVLDQAHLAGHAKLCSFHPLIALD